MAGPAGKKRAARIVPHLNVFSIIDHMCGGYVRGADGAYYLNGGYHHIMGFGGIGNSYKTALAIALHMTATARYNPDYSEIYDSEITLPVDRLQFVVDGIKEWKLGSVHDLLSADDDSRQFNLVTSAEFFIDDWWELYKKSVSDRMKVKKSAWVSTPWTDFEGGYVKTTRPWLLLADSMSASTVKASEKILDSGEAGSSSSNIHALKEMNAKSQILTQMPTVTARANIYMGLVAHLGIKPNLNPMAAPVKRLSSFKGDYTFKRVPENFTFFTNSCLISYGSYPMLNKGTKKPEYPYDAEDDFVGNGDLVRVKYEQMRGKSGPTGMSVELMFSQSQGFLPGVTEFHFIKDKCDTFGMAVKGNNQGFTLDLLPDVFFTRARVRKIADENVMWKRAVEITAGLAYIQKNTVKLDDALRIKPADIYTALKEKGYDWDYILNETVEYWQYKEDIVKPTLTAMSILHIAAGNLDLPKLKKKRK